MKVNNKSSGAESYLRQLHASSAFVLDARETKVNRNMNTLFFLVNKGAKMLSVNISLNVDFGIF